MKLRKKTWNLNVINRLKLPVNHVFSATSSTSIFVPKNKIYDDTLYKF